MNNASIVIVAKKNNVKIENSYIIDQISDIKFYVKKLYTPKDGKEPELSHKRSEKSYVREWFAHNIMYEKGFFRNRTKDADLNADESLLRRICYFLIYSFYKNNPKYNVW